MNLSKSSNPVLKEKTFSRDYTMQSDVMTVNGTMNKTAILLLLVVASSVYVWNKFFEAVASNPDAALATVGPWIAIGGIGGLITALVTVFRPKSSGISAPIYAIFEGLLLGGISAILELQYQGIVMRAVGLTLAVFAVMLFLYRSGAIKVTQKFKMGIFCCNRRYCLSLFGEFYWRLLWCGILFPEW